MSETAKALGVLSTFPYLGKEYKVPAMGPDFRANYSAWLEKEAWGGATRSKQYLSPLDYRENLREVGRDIAAHVYEADGAVFAKSLESKAGFVQMLYLRFKEGNPEADEITVPWVIKLVDDQPEEIQAFLIALDTDPNAKAPA